MWSCWIFTGHDPQQQAHLAEMNSRLNRENWTYDRFFVRSKKLCLVSPEESGYRKWQPRFPISRAAT